jgi:hypothetical protein
MVVDSRSSLVEVLGINLYHLNFAKTGLSCDNREIRNCDYRSNSNELDWMRSVNMIMLHNWGISEFYSLPFTRSDFSRQTE